MEPFNTDDDDDWFHDSIRRYGKMIMFEMEHSVRQIEQSDSSMIVVLSRKKSGDALISELRLPLKLLKTLPKNEGILKDYDLKIMSGTFAGPKTTQIAVHTASRSVLASEEGLFGVLVYGLPDADSDYIQKKNLFSQPLSNPNLAINGDTLALTRSVNENSIFIDVNSNSVSCVIEGHPNEKPDSIVPVFLGTNVVSLGQENGGTMTIHDLKSGHQIGSIEGDSSSGTTWTFGSSFKPNFTQTDTSDVRVAKLSDNSRLCLFDMRNLSKALAMSYLKIEGSLGPKQVKFSPTNSDIISVSGFDRNVYVYDVSSDFKIIFTHDGHAHMDNCDRVTTTTSHIWYPQGGDNVIISGALNSSINCWEFNAER